jgi:hypothetical protein
MSAEEDTDDLRSMIDSFLVQLGGRLRANPPPKRDWDAIEVAVRHAALRANDLGIVSGVAQANERAAELGFDLNCNPIVGASTEVPDRWFELYGDTEDTGDGEDD